MADWKLMVNSAIASSSHPFAFMNHVVYRCGRLHDIPVPDILTFLKSGTDTETLFLRCQLRRNPLQPANVWGFLFGKAHKRNWLSKVWSTILWSRVSTIISWARNDSTRSGFVIKVFSPVYLVNKPTSIILTPRKRLGPGPPLGVRYSWLWDCELKCGMRGGPNQSSSRSTRIEQIAKKIL